MPKFLNTYRSESNRLKDFDYGSNGYYFITISTYKKSKYFGEIVKTVEREYIPSLQTTEMAVVAQNYWLEIPLHFSFVKLDEFIIMPDHIHGILKFEKTNKTDWTPNTFTSPNQNLGSVIRSYKAAVKRFATKNGIDFKWQADYHDRIIRDVRELNSVRLYIKSNPLR